MKRTSSLLFPIAWALGTALASIEAIPRVALADGAPPVRADGTATGRVAEALAGALAKAPARVVVATAPLVSDAPAPRGADLANLVATLVAGKRGAGSRARPGPLPIGEARAAARGEAALVYLRPEIAAGKLRVTADVYPVPKSVWSRIRDPEPGPVMHAYAEAPLDAEVRSFLAPVPLSSAKVERAKNFESDVVALACGDLDGDGALEIVALSRRRVSTLRLRGGRVEILASRPWVELSPVAPAPLREPIGFATIVATSRAAFLDVALTDRAKSLRLGPDLAPRSELVGLALPDGDGSACTRVTGLAVTGPLAPCLAGDPSPRAPSVGGQYDAYASARIVAKDGSASNVWAGRERGSLEARDDRGHRTATDTVGAQLAVGDLDQDGEPEILASLDTANPFDDAVVVRTWDRAAPIALGAGSSARLREVARIPAPAGVHAIAVCPPDTSGAAPFVVATADEIWVVR